MNENEGDYVLPSQKEEMVEGLIYCGECNQPMKKVLLARYEYVDGYPLHNF